MSRVNKCSLTIKLLNFLYKHTPRHSIYDSYIWSNTKLYGLGHSPALLFYNFNFHWRLPSIQYFWYLNNFLKISFLELYNCYHDLHLEIFIPSDVYFYTLTADLFPISHKQPLVCILSLWFAFLPFKKYFI